MKRRAFFEKAAQLAAAIGLGGAAALAGAKPSDAASFPPRGPARVEPTDWEKDYAQNYYALRFKIQDEQMRDDLYGVFQRADEEMKKHRERERELIFGGK